MTTRAKKRPIDFRDHRLVIGLLGALYDAEHDLDPKDLEAQFAGDLWKPDTVSRTIGDLVELGAIRRIKPRTGGPRARSALRMTGLGRAWIDRRLEPFVPNDELDDDDEDPVDLD